jgi:hypothetical protein
MGDFMDNGLLRPGPGRWQAPNGAGLKFRLFATISPAKHRNRVVSEDNPIRIYVTHNFSETDEYLRVFEFLESLEHFFYLNTSKPENAPKAGTMEAVKDEWILQIKEAEAVIVLASLYVEQKDSVSYQLDVAAANEKPIIAIRPFGGLLESPPELLARVHEHIEWNNREMVDAIKRQARLEDTTRWEVIDFP